MGGPLKMTFFENEDKEPLLKKSSSHMTSPSSTPSTITAAVSLLSGEAEGMYVCLVCVVCVFVCLSKCVFVLGDGFSV